MQRTRASAFLLCTLSGRSPLMPGVGRLIKRHADETGEVERMRTQKFGCELCWPADARAAWVARGGLTRLEGLVDESHFIVTILACPRCDQRYVSIFTETIDW